MDSPPCSIFPDGHIAEVGKNCYDTVSTFLVSAKEGLGSPGTLVGPEIANSGRRIQKSSSLVTTASTSASQYFSSSWSSHLGEGTHHGDLRLQWKLSGPPIRTGGGVRAET